MVSSENVILLGLLVALNPNLVVSDYFDYSPMEAPESPGFDTSCQCDTKKVWNDVMFLVDRSNATTRPGFSEMVDTIITLLDPAFNVQPYGYNVDNYWLNTGIVFYNSNATVALPLGSSLDDFYNLNSDDYFDINDPYSNLEKGLDAAIKQFSGPRSRRASRMVLVVMASTFNPTGPDSALLAAKQFQADNGIIMSYNAILLHGEPLPLLKEIASPGFFFDSQTSQISDLLQAQCDANCFCADNSMSLSESDRGYPTKGCYPSVTMPANQRLSERGCEQRQNGILVKIENAFKNTFVGQLIYPLEDTWIGLKWNSTNNAWMWVDATPLSTYNNFPGGAGHTDDNDCVILEKRSLYWIPVSCTIGCQYNCQTKPYDSTNWCDLSY